MASTMQNSTNPTASDLEREAKRQGVAKAGTARVKRSRPKNFLLMVIILGLVGFNAWWYWRDTRPLANKKTIDRWISGKQYDLAEFDLREQLRRSAYDGEARMTLARLLAVQGDDISAARELQKVPFWSPRKAEALFLEGTIHLMLNRAKDAEAAFLEIIKDDPLHPQPPDIYHDAFFEIMKLYATQDRWDDAFANLWRAYELATPRDRYTLLLWRMRAELERVAPAESLPRLQSYVAADPTDIESLRALARAEQALGKFDDSERDFRLCLKLAPNDGRVWRDYIAMLHERGDRKGCFAAVERAPREAEVEPEFLKFRAMAREDLGDYASAADCYRAAIERNPNVVEYHYKLAIVEERLGNREKAAEQRKLAKTLREARAELPKAYTDFLEARDDLPTGGPDIAQAVQNLSKVCRVLGFTKAADAWIEVGSASAWK